MSICPRCDSEGPHYIPPSFGETGFFSCDPTDGPRPSRTPENYMGFRCFSCHHAIEPGGKEGETWRIVAGVYAHVACPGGAA